ncbi:Transcriptional regulator AbiEi antitoxin N-terminal domain-containing protein [Hyphomicrobium sp. 1Nfss2.1]|uniref:type IV toxin-antitoxin system AbiEi family antitoxin domain-containing protein n=1 Tax=Hyphomicrobium sp. 1Nfss2.1 TaxID=3413936 RepID=UPI003C7E91F1
MSTQKLGKLNWLARHLPEGMPVDAAWLRRQGYTANLLRKYEAARWLSQPAHRVYVRPRGSLTWEQIVLSLQTLLRLDVVVGGRTALELHGYAHYLQQTVTEVHLYGPTPLPTWLKTLPVDVRFIYHNDGRLFRTHRASTAPYQLEGPSEAAKRPEGVTVQPWGPGNWPLVLSTPERAVLELLDELPDRESFHQADMLMEGLSTLSPSRMEKLLVDCRSIKVKRLFFFFADRHKHAWLKRIDRKAIDLGKGKRVLVKGGKLDAKHMITVPEDLDAAG